MDLHPPQFFWRLGPDLAPYPIGDIAQHGAQEGDAKESEGGIGQGAVVDDLW